MSETFRGGTKLAGAYVWRDLIGELTPKPSGGNQPVYGVFRGGLAQVPFFSTNDIAFVTFHIPHDWAFGTDLFFHLHWSHNGTAISGTLGVTCGVTYAKGHNQADFPVEVSPVFTVSTPDIATIPRWRHRIDEIQLSAASPSATQLDTDNIEVDGLIIVGVQLTTHPTISGSALGAAGNHPVLLYTDLHYQSQNIGTKNKAPDFYT